MRKKVLMVSSVASMIDQFNMSNIYLMLDMGYEVHVVCNFEKGNTCSAERLDRLKTTLAQMHVAWHQWDCPRGMRAGDFIEAFWQLWDLTGRNRFEWMHCQSPVGGVLARAVACGRGIRVIYTAHGFHFYKGAPLKNWLLFYPVEKVLAHVTDVLITINKEDYLFASKKLNAGKVCYTPGVGIDTVRFRRQTGADGMQNDGEKPKHAVHKACSNRQRGAADGMQNDSEKLKHAVHRVCSNRQRGADGGIQYINEKQRLRGQENAGDALQAAERKKFCRKYRMPADTVVLLSVGELNRGKNHRMVIEAMAETARTDIYYLICGQGGLRKELRRLADRLGVGERLRMPGYQVNMPWIYQNADIFVFPSIREGMPVALMEAMAAGLPCAVSDIRGSRELVTDEKMRFRLDRPDQLRSILEMLAASRRLRQKCGMENQTNVNDYDIRNVRKRMEKIYRYCSGMTE